MSSEFANSGKQQQQQQQQSESGKHDVNKFNSDNESDYGKNSFAVIKFKIKKKLKLFNF